MQMLQKEEQAASRADRCEWFMWEAELQKFIPLVCMKCSIMWCMYTFINLMVDANFLIKDGSVSLSYAESIHN